MIEKVARAIKWEGMELERKLRWSSPDNMPINDDDLAQAKAAVAAMREPDEAMVDAGCVYAWDYRHSDAKYCWRAMIDSILAGK